MAPWSRRGHRPPANPESPRGEKASQGSFATFPNLPESTQEIEIRNLTVNDAVVKPRFERHDYRISVNIEERLGYVEIVSIK
jgi:hypothetical protein